MLAVSSVLYRLYANVLRHVLTAWCMTHKVLPAEHFGFIPGRSTMQPMFILRHLVHAQKASADAKHRKLFTAFIDFKQAYDHIPRQQLWEHLRVGVKLPQPLLACLEGLYRDDNYVLIDGPHRTPPVTPDQAEEWTGGVEEEWRSPDRRSGAVKKTKLGAEDEEGEDEAGRPSPAQPSPAQPSPAQPSPAQPSPAQPSPAQPSPAQPSPAQPSPAQPSPAQPSPAQPSPAQPSPAQPSPAQPSPAQPSPAQPSPAQPSPAQPSPAQPSPAQPSPAQPSPAQPPSSPYHKKQVHGAQEEPGTAAMEAMPRSNLERATWSGQFGVAAHPAHPGHAKATHHNDPSHPSHKG
ncbi:hypothetical protein QJQ45_004540 [Haematococcus lacustris]|nr:hypothetical protein QJQ45_004540 [Haematococcus lacustris]